MKYPISSICREKVFNKVGVNRVLLLISYNLNIISGILYCVLRYP